MDESNRKADQIETASARFRFDAKAVSYAAHVGLDVHKGTIAVAVAERGRGEPIYRAQSHPLRQLASQARHLQRYLQRIPGQTVSLDISRQAARRLND